MLYLDVLFPVNLPPLTYACPPDLEASAVPGSLVSAPLRKRAAAGIVVARRTSSPVGKVKDIIKVEGDGPLLSAAMLKLLSWMADYYLAPAGVVLKYTIPAVLFTPKRQRGTRALRPGEIEPSAEPDDEAFAHLLSPDPGFRVTLVHSPSLARELSLVRKMASEKRNVIVLCPDIALAERAYTYAAQGGGSRVELLHSGIPRGAQTAAVQRLMDGGSDVVVGTGHALFVPMKQAGTIVVLSEESRWYKTEEGFRYQTRDVAVMRGSLEKAAVILTSAAPSAESYYNTLNRKYRFLRLAPGKPSPALRIVDLRKEKMAAPGIARPVASAARQALEKNGRVLFLREKKGYASSLVCSDCGHVETCPDCLLPLSLSRQANALLCRFCGHTYPPPQTCRNCGSTKIIPAGAGTEKVAETLKGLLKAEPLRFDRDVIHTKEEQRAASEALASASSQLVVATSFLLGDPGPGPTFDIAAVLGIDSSLHLPDFRAAEHVYRMLQRVLRSVVPEGRVYVQTRFAGLPLFRDLVPGRYESFMKGELSQRKSFGYPPYSRMISLIIHGTQEDAHACLDAVRATGITIEMLGPVEERDRTGRPHQVVVLRDKARKPLNEAAKAFLECAPPGMQIEVDVDPQ